MVTGVCPTGDTPVDPGSWQADNNEQNFLNFSGNSLFIEPHRNKWADEGGRVRRYVKTGCKRRE
jgi:hypothetical protein